MSTIVDSVINEKGINNSIKEFDYFKSIALEDDT